MSARIAWIAILVLGCLLKGNAQEKTNLSYQQLLDRVKNADLKADFFQLRMAFTQTPLYKPYGDKDKTAEAMNAALDKKDYTTWRSGWQTKS